MGKRVVVVGGDAAGMSAASQIRRANPELAVTVYEQGAYAAYGACGIPYLIIGEVDSYESLLALGADDFARRGIEVCLQHQVVAVKPGARVVEVRHGAGAVRSVRYDYLVLATGAVPVAPAWMEVSVAQVHGLRGLSDGMTVRRIIDSGQVARAVIVGTGLIGMEMAEALSKRGLQVTVIGRSQRMIFGLDRVFLEPVVRSLSDRGIELLQDQTVTGLQSQAGRVSAVVLLDRRIPADLVIVATGVRPSTALAREAGIGVGRSGGIAVSDRLKTEVPGVYAAGDCVELTHIVTGARVVAPLALTANRTGRIAGDNLAAESLGRLSAQRFRGTAGTAVTRVFDHSVACAGLDEEQARAAGFAPAVFERESRSRASYYPGGTPVYTRIVVDRRTQRLLGAQILGQEGVAGRIDVVAAALFNRMTVQQVYDLELAYAPPFGPVYDPLIEVCGRAALELGAL